MRLRSFCASAFVVAIVATASATARADDVTTDTIPGAFAAPPPSPSNVAPPESGDDPRLRDPQGTTSVVADDEIALRDARDRFRIFPMGRLQIDTYGYAGRGVVDYQRADGTGLKTSTRLSRLRLELAGRVMQRWYFWLGAEFGSGPAFESSQKPSSFASAADAFIGYEFGSFFRVQFGQFDVPFTMENVTSDRWRSFMERSLTVRTVGAPYNKDLGVMVRGETPQGHLSYALAFVGGDGQNRPSVDNRGDGAGRIMFRPFASLERSPLRRLHVGVSGRIGRRDPTYVRYDAPALATPGGYVFWSPTYGSATAETHVIPSAMQRAGALEAFVPLDRFDLQAEAVFLHEERRESYASTLDDPQRSGTLSGKSYYVQLAFWPCGTPRLTGEPGTYLDAQIDRKMPREPQHALQLVVRWEQLFLDYDSIARSYVGDALVAGVKPGALDALTKAIRVDALQVGATYWATKHVRLTAVWSWYRFPGGADGNQAVAPGARANANDAAARSLHELGARVALAL